jgi:hypothetical protein
MENLLTNRLGAPVLNTDPVQLDQLGLGGLQFPGNPLQAPQLPFQPAPPQGLLLGEPALNFSLQQQNLQFPEFNPTQNYENEFWRIYFDNEYCIAQIKTATREIDELKQQIDQYQVRPGPNPRAT